MTDDRSTVESLMEEPRLEYAFEGTSRKLFEAKAEIVFLRARITELEKLLHSSRSIVFTEEQLADIALGFEEAERAEPMTLDEFEKRVNGEE